MGTLVTQAVKNGEIAQTAGYGEIAMSRGLFVQENAALALNDIIDAVILPANHVPIDLVVEADDADSNGAPAITLDAGLITGTPGDTVGTRTCGNEFFAASTVAQAGGVARMAKAVGARMASAPVERSVGLKVAAAAATAVTPSYAGLTFKTYKQGTAFAVNDAIRLPNGVVMKVTTAGNTGVYQNPDANLNPTQYGPNWNMGRALTTTDGTVVWTCESVLIGVTLYSRPARDGL